MTARKEIRAKKEIKGILAWVRLCLTVVLTVYPFIRIPVTRLDILYPVQIYKIECLHLKEELQS